MNNKTTDQLLTELLELNKQHINTLNERINILKQTIKIQNDTINNYLIEQQEVSHFEYDKNGNNIII